MSVDCFGKFSHSLPKTHAFAIFQNCSTLSKFSWPHVVDLAHQYSGIQNPYRGVF